MPASQVVSVKIGAVLAASFSEGFGKAEKGVTSLTKKVDALNTAFTRVTKGGDDFLTALRKQMQHMTGVESRLSAMTNALRTHGSVQGQVANGIGTMTKRWEAAARARAAWNKAMSVMPPALPSGALRPPPAFVPPSRRGGGGGGGGGAAAGGIGGVGAALGGLGAGYTTIRLLRGVQGGVMASAAFDAQLQGVLNTAEQDASMLGEVRQRIMGMTSRNATNQSATSLLGGLNIFAAAGTLDFQDQLSATATSGMVATASQASVDDISKVGVSLMQNLKIKASSLGDAFGMLTIAGKEGSFELKDMAMHFPSVGAMAANLGMTGESGVASIAAAMQVIRKNTGTGGEAATNMENLLSKITAYETTQRLEKKGIKWSDKVREVMASGGRMNMLDEFISMMKTATKGDPLLMKELVPDMQANAALVAMMQHEAEYKAINAKVAQGSEQDALVDFAKNAATTQGSIDALANASYRIGAAFGKAFDSVLPALAAVGTVVADVFDVIGNQAPGAIVAVTGALVALGGTIAGLGLTAMVGPVVVGFGLLKAGLIAVGATITTAILPALPVIGVVVGAVAAGALLIWKFWEPLKAFFTGFGMGVAEGLAPLRDAFAAMFDSLVPAFGVLSDVVMSVLEPLGLTTDEFGNILSVGQTIGKVVGESLRLLLLPIELVLKGLTKIQELAGGGESIRGKEAGMTPEQVAGYNAARQKLVDAKVWDSNAGRDDINVGELGKMAKSGKITAAELSLLAMGQNSSAIANGNTLGDDYVGSVRLLADITAKKEARAGSEATVNQSNNVTVVVNGAGDPAAVGKDVASRQQDIAKGHANEARSQLRATFSDSTSPNTNQ